MTNDTNPFRYCGEYYDSETDNIYLRARYYDPAISRMLSEDPAKSGINWYIYCNNNPIRYKDPTGYWAADGSDENYKLSNSIVYQSLEHLTNSWNNLDALEKVGVDIDNAKLEVAALANEVRRVGNSMVVKSSWATDYAGLNATEIVIYMSNSDNGWEMLWAGKTALDTTAKMFDNSSDSTPGNAFQHAFWNALGVNKTGDATYVEFYTDAHEFGNSFTSSSAEEFAKMNMDLFNNGVGRYQQSLNSDASKDKLKEIIYKRLKDGGLKWIEPGDTGNKYAPKQ